ncbi:hypothetical protein ACFWMX_10585 [Streptomyces sp. NPDC058378]|uniref:hypothetical protein n=1 Tax=Streptomyces sp. NPDC058378 TaxID=3346469 RepID=UPI00365DA2D6
MALGVVVVAGAGVVLFQPDHREPALSVPDRVCQEAVSGTQVKALLPGTGEAFEEKRAVNFVVGGPQELGRCDLSGGGTDLEVTYKMAQEADFTWKSVQPDSASDQDVALSNLKEKLSTSGWVLKDSYLDNSPNKNLNLVADNDSKKASVWIVGYSKDDPPSLSIQVVAACYQVPDGQTVDHY